MIKRKNWGKNSYFTTDKARKIVEYLHGYLKRIRSGERLTISISDHNSKMGAIPSISLLPVVTCNPICKNTCGKDCYACKLCNLRDEVRQAYARNTAIYYNDPYEFFYQVNNALRGYRFFRYNVSGDIPAPFFFNQVVKSACKNKHCDILIFTKKYNIVNNYLDSHNGKLPKNLHVIFSAWPGITSQNPYNLPVSYPYITDDEILPGSFICAGDCYKCACNGYGCYRIGRGGKIAFSLH